MIITNEKLVAIQNFRFLISLKYLKMYFDKTKYFRQYVSYYAQKAKLLQNRKIHLLQNELIKNVTRKRHTHKIILDELTFIEINLFQRLQDSLNKSTFFYSFQQD